MKCIKYHAGYKYQLHETYVVQTHIKPLEKEVIHGFVKLDINGLLTINEGYAWDGPSGPTFDTKNFMRGSLVHDALYQLMREKHLDCGWRPTADEELVRICKEDGMSALRRWWVLKGVRFGGESSAKWQAEKILIAP